MATTRNRQDWLGDDAFARMLRDEQLGPNDDVTLLAYRFLLSQFEALVRHQGSVEKNDSPEGVHQMRVAIRRVRALLRAFAETTALKPLKKLNKDLKWVAGQLGEVRDLDVFLSSVGPLESSFPQQYRSGLIAFEDDLKQHRRKAVAEIKLSLASERYQRLVRRFADFLKSEPQPSQFTRLKIPAAAAAWIGKQYQTVLRDGRCITPASPDSQLHALRIDCKRLRYLFEFFRLLFGKQLKQPIRELKKLQEILGVVQDTHVATEWLLAYAERMPERPDSKSILLALGHLVCLEQQRMALHRESFFQAWSDFDRKGRRKQLLTALRHP